MSSHVHMERTISSRPARVAGKTHATIGEFQLKPFYNLPLQPKLGNRDRVRQNLGATNIKTSASIASLQQTQTPRTLSRSTMSRDEKNMKRRLEKSLDRLTIEAQSRKDTMAETATSIEMDLGMNVGGSLPEYVTEVKPKVTKTRGSLKMPDYEQSPNKKWMTRIGEHLHLSKYDDGRRPDFDSTVAFEEKAQRNIKRLAKEFQLEMSTQNVDFSSPREVPKENLPAPPPPLNELGLNLRDTDMKRQMRNVETLYSTALFRQVQRNIYGITQEFLRYTSKERREGRDPRGIVDHETFIDCVSKAIPSMDKDLLRSMLKIDRLPEIFKWEDYLNYGPSWVKPPPELERVVPFSKKEYSEEEYIKSNKLFSLLRNKFSRMVPHSILDLFKGQDHNSDGFVSRDEFQNIMLELALPISEGEANALIDEVELNEKGELNVRDFVYKIVEFREPADFAPGKALACKPDVDAYGEAWNCDDTSAKETRQKIKEEQRNRFASDEDEKRYEHFLNYSKDPDRTLGKPESTYEYETVRDSFIIPDLDLPSSSQGKRVEKKMIEVHKRAKEAQSPPKSPKVLLYTLTAGLNRLSEDDRPESMKKTLARIQHLEGAEQTNRPSSAPSSNSFRRPPSGNTPRMKGMTSKNCPRSSGGHPPTPVGNCSGSYSATPKSLSQVSRPSSADGSLLKSNTTRSILSDISNHFTQSPASRPKTAPGGKGRTPNRLRVPSQGPRVTAPTMKKVFGPHHVEDSVREDMFAKETSEEPLSYLEDFVTEQIVDRLNNTTRHSHTPVLADTFVNHKPPQNCGMSISAHDRFRTSFRGPEMYCSVPAYFDRSKHSIAEARMERKKRGNRLQESISRQNQSLAGVQDWMNVRNKGVCQYKYLDTIARKQSEFNPQIGPAKKVAAKEKSFLSHGSGDFSARASVRPGSAPVSQTGGVRAS